MPSAAIELDPAEFGQDLEVRSATQAVLGVRRYRVDDAVDSTEALTAAGLPPIGSAWDATFTSLVVKRLVPLAIGHRQWLIEARYDNPTYSVGRRRPITNSRYTVYDTVHYVQQINADINQGSIPDGGTTMEGWLGAADVFEELTSPPNINTLIGLIPTEAGQVQRAVVNDAAITLPSTLEQQSQGTSPTAGETFAAGQIKYMGAKLVDSREGIHVVRHRVELAPDWKFRRWAKDPLTNKVKFPLDPIMHDIYPSADLSMILS